MRLDLFFNTLPIIAMGLVQIFAVTAVIIFIVKMLNMVDEKIAKK